MSTSDDISRGRIFDLALPSVKLECGFTVSNTILRGWWWGPSNDLERLCALSNVLDKDVGDDLNHKVISRSADEWQVLEKKQRANAAAAPAGSVKGTVLFVHALTGDMRVCGKNGWWPNIVGPDGAVNPDEYRVLCFNNLGSCYGSSGPTQEGFPPHPSDPNRFAPLTTWDQAGAILSALEQLKITRIDAVIGGSLGGAIALCLAALSPKRFATVVPIAAAEASPAWVIGWNHIARQAILNDPDYPDSPKKGLSLARQLAHLTYRAAHGLQQRHGRHLEPSPFSRKGSIGEAYIPYRIQSYLNHQGECLVERFDARDAMDNHDLSRDPYSNEEDGDEPFSPGVISPGKLANPSDSFGLSRIEAALFAAYVDSDELFFSEQTELLVKRLQHLGKRAECNEIIPLIVKALEYADKY